MRFSHAELLSPTSAKQNYFNALPDTATYGWANEKPWEISATARSLSNNPQKIFGFVKNNIRYELRYGAQKGAVGAIIDRSGTAFDQAQLLVELLRAAGYGASYQVGTITLTWPEFTAWTGISDPAAAGQILANGGIPAEVTGSYVRMGHAWVSATIGGSTVILDPSYKPMARWTQIDVAGGSGFSASGFVSAAASATLQSEAGVSYITGVNLPAAVGQLDNAATQLLDTLKANWANKSAEEIMGGEKIEPYEDPWAHKTTGTLSADWGVFGGGLPNKFRTKVTLSSGCTFPVYADEIYGRRLIFHTPQSQETGPYESDSLPGYGFVIGDKPISQAKPAGYFGLTCPGGMPPLTLSIAVDLPYAARSAIGQPYGSWMDRTSLKVFDQSGAVQIVLGWGDAGSELQARLGDDFGDPPPSFPMGQGIPGPGAGEYYGPPLDGGGPADAGADARLYAAWMAQMSRAMILLEGISRTRIQHHYTIGLVYSQVQGQAHDNGAIDHVHEPGEAVIAGTKIDGATRIDLDSGYSVASLLGAPQDVFAARHTVAALGSMLEGSVFEQQHDAVDTASTPQRFVWGQEKLASTIRYYQLVPGAASPTELRDGATPPFDMGAPCQGQLTANQGYTVLQPNDRYLGPGGDLPWTASIYSGFDPYRERTPQSDRSMHRGCAWIAFNADASEIAHIVTSVDRAFKGAGGPSQRDIANIEAPPQADLLKDLFKDRSNIGGVDLRTGAYTYRPAPDLVVGQGEFPYSLSFQRVFQAGGATCPKCAKGWTHNYDIRASFSGGGLEAMGETVPYALASPLVGLKAAFELYKAEAATPSIGNHLAAMGVMRWLSQRFTYNVVTVTQGASSEPFVRLADQLFSAAPSSQSTLTQSGTRFAWDDNARHGRSKAWLYGGPNNPDPITLVRTSGSGDKITFEWREWNPTELPLVQNDYGALRGFAQGFFAKTWTFPRGVALSFTYCNEAPVTYGGEPGIHMVQSLSIPCADRLQRVSNNLGLWLEIDRTDVISSDGRSAFAQEGTNVIGRTFQTWGGQTMSQNPLVVKSYVDVMGQQWPFEWELPAVTDRPASDVRLKRLLQPATYTGNRRPRAEDDFFPVPTNVNSTIQPLINDTDPDVGDNLSIYGVGIPEHGSVKIWGSALLYTPKPNYVGLDRFRYSVSDGHGTASLGRATVTVNVGGTPQPLPDLCSNIAGLQTEVPSGYTRTAANECFPVPVNRAPVAVADNFSFDGVNAVFNPVNNDYDDDGDALALTGFQSSPSGITGYGTANHEVLLMNRSPTNGTPRVYEYAVRDSHGAVSNTTTMSFTVPNFPPTANVDNITIDVSTDELWFYPLVNDSDPNGDSLTIISTTMGGVHSELPGNRIRMMGGMAAGNTYAFNYTIADPAGLTSTSTMTVTVVDSGGCRPNLPCN